MNLLLALAGANQEPPPGDLTNFVAFEGTHTADQAWVIPAGTSWIQFKCWGGISVNAGGPHSGGGGYVGGKLPVGALPGTNVGDSLAIVANAFAQQSGVNPGTYGFGGGIAGGTGNRTGGQIAGIFTGTAAVLATDTARAIMVAGGGGGRSDFGANFAGWGGNQAARSGGEVTMQGSTGNGAGRGGGGGGFSGGDQTNTGNSTFGGTSFIHATVVEQDEQPGTAVTNGGRAVTDFTTADRVAIRWE